MPLSVVRSRRFRAGPFLFLVAWVTCVAAGFAFAVRYASGPGAGASAPSTMAAAPELGAWPADRFRLLVFVHPQCPCTRASIEELDRIAARAGSHASIRAYFLSDPEADEAGTRSATRSAAAAIPGVEVVADPRGETARAFGVRTSGETLLYSPSGELVFQGGITSARGHAGDNAGVDAIVAALLGEPVRVATTPVFGCALFETAPDGGRP
jgi:hypothetical protein